MKRRGWPLLRFFSGGGEGVFSRLSPIFSFYSSFSFRLFSLFYVTVYLVVFFNSFGC